MPRICKVKEEGFYLTKTTFLMERVLLAQIVKLESSNHFDIWTVWSKDTVVRWWFEVLLRLVLLIQEYGFKPE